MVLYINTRLDFTVQAVFTLRWKIFLKHLLNKILISKTVPWLRQLVVIPSARILAFDPMPILFEICGRH